MAIVAIIIAAIQWRQRRMEESRPLEIELLSWSTKRIDPYGEDFDVLAEATIQIRNPASVDNGVKHAELRLRMADGVGAFVPALKPEKRSGRGPWVLGSAKVSGDALNVPINVPAHQLIRGELHFDLPANLLFDATRDTLKMDEPSLSLCLEDLRGSEIVLDIMRGPWRRP